MEFMWRAQFPAGRPGSFKYCLLYLILRAILGRELLIRNRFFDCSFFETKSILHTISSFLDKVFSLSLRQTFGPAKGTGRELLETKEVDPEDTLEIEKHRPYRRALCSPHKFKRWNCHKTENDIREQKKIREGVLK